MNTAGILSVLKRLSTAVKKIDWCEVFLIGIMAVITCLLVLIICATALWYSFWAGCNV